MASRFLITGGGSVTWDASNTAIWSATSGGGTGASVPGSGDTVTMDAASGGGTVTLGYDPTITSITMGAFTGTFAGSTFSPTMTSFSNTGTGVRTFTGGSGTWTITGNNAAVWTCADLTNCTYTPTTNAIILNYSGASGSRTISHGSTVGASETTAQSFSVTAGTDNIALAATSAVKNINYTGFSGTVTNTSVTFYGNFTASATTIFTDGNGVYTFAATSGTQTITSNTASVNRGITINCPGATFLTADDFNATGGAGRALIFTAGTLNDNGKNLTFLTFSSNNSNARTYTLSGSLRISGNNATVWNTSTMTGLVLNQTGSINFIYSGSTGTRTITSSTLAAGATEANVPSFSVTAGTDIVTFTTARLLKTLNFTGFTGTWTPTALTFYGGLVVSTAMTVGSAAVALTFAATFGTNTITTNSNTTFGTGGTTVTINGISGAYQWGSNFASLSTLTLTAGSLNFNNFNTTTTVFSSSNSNARSLIMGSGTVLLTGTGTIWNITTSTGMTFNADTSTITANDASASTKTFAFNAMTYYNLRLTGAGTGIFQLGLTTATTVFNRITVDTSPKNIQVFAGKTIQLTSAAGWNVTGASGSLISLKSTTNGVAWNIVVSSGTVVSNYISLQDSVASGGATFYAGNHSTNVSGNSGWIFTNPAIAASENASRDENFVPTLLATDQSDVLKTVRIQANPSTHGLKINDATDGYDNGGTIAPRDQNRVSAILAVSSADGVTPVTVYIDSTTHELLITSA